MESIQTARQRLASRGPAGRPFVYLNAAMTADGKLAPADRRFVAFGSQRDQDHLHELRTTADAVMAGARTVDLAPATMGPGGAQYRRRRLQLGLAEFNLRVIVSGSGTVNPAAAIFQLRCSPIIILTTGRVRPRQLGVLRGLADEVKICGDEQLDFSFALQWLRQQWGVKRLLCEGGGEINGALVTAGLVDEIHVTLCPVILGGRTAPTLADGAGFAALADAAALELQSRRRVGDEMFLVYRVIAPARQPVLPGR